MKNKSVIEVSSFLLILLFFYTGLSKLTDLSFFRTQLHLYPYIHSFAPLIAIGIPVLEMFIAILLVPSYEQTRRIGFSVSLVLLSLFTLYLVMMVATQSHLPCSCGGVISKMTWKRHIIFNLLFITISAVGLRSMKARSAGNYPSNVIMNR